MTFDEWWGEDGPWSRQGQPGLNSHLKEPFRKAWDAAVAAERERCAKLVEPFVTAPHGVGISYWGEALAARIREG